MKKDEPQSSIIIYGTEQMEAAKRGLQTVLSINLSVQAEQKWKDI
jgi:hypothetical protein